MKIKNRIFLSIFLSSFAALALALLLVTRVMYSATVNELRTEIKNEAEYISSALDIMGDTDRFSAYLTENGGKGENRITLCGSGGEVLYDNYADAASLDNHLDRPEIAEAIKNGTGSSVRASDTLGEQTYYYAIRLENGNILRIANTSKNAAGLIGNSVLWIFFIAVLITVISFIIAEILSNKIIRPVNGIDLDKPLSNETYEELSPLLTRMDKQNKEISAQIEELSRQKNELSYIMDNMNEGLVLFDRAGNILSANSSAEKIFGGASDGNYIQLCHAKEYTDTVEAAQNEEKSSAKFEKDGRVYRLAASPVLGNGMVLFIIDITDQENAEQMRREFSANVSHELKTPLTSVMGAAELIETGLAKQEDIPHFAGKIRSEASRLLALIEDIIKISRLDEDDLRQEFEAVQLDEVCKNVIDDLKAKADSKDITLECNAEKTEISGVKPVLYEMIYNLCDNGIIYNKNGGYVRLTLQKSESGCILAVSDNGIGIPAEHHSRIFERFYRVDKSRSKERGGTGLGLSIVKHGAALHNGEITLESEVNRGTRIMIEFKR